MPEVVKHALHTAVPAPIVLGPNRLSSIEYVMRLLDQS
jgi:hypothetical protein